MHNCIISANTWVDSNTLELSSASPICTSVVCLAALITYWLVAPKVPSEVGEILQGSIYRIHDLPTRSAHLIVLLTRSGQTIVDLDVSRSS